MRINSAHHGEEVVEHRQDFRHILPDSPNAAGQNEGSCKLLGLALLEGFSAEETLLAFGEHYRSVLATPDGSDHGNIRALMDTGLAGVRFEQPSLRRK